MVERGGRLAPAVTAVACLVAVAALAWWGALALHHRALHRYASEQARKEATRAGWRHIGQQDEFCRRCGCDVFECGGNVTGVCIRTGGRYG